MGTGHPGRQDAVIRARVAASISATAAANPVSSLRGDEEAVVGEAGGAVEGAAVGSGEATGERSEPEHAVSSTAAAQSHRRTRPRLSLIASR